MYIILVPLFLLSASTFGSSFYNCQFKVKILKRTEIGADVKLIPSVSKKGSAKPIQSAECRINRTEESIKLEDIVKGKELIKPGALVIGVRTFYSAMMGDKGPVSGFSWEFSQQP